MTANNICVGKNKNALAAKKTLIGCILLLLSLVACSTQNFSSEAATQTVVARSRLQEGLYLVMDGEPVPLDRQIQVGGKGIDVSQVPQVNESHPLVLLKATDDQVLDAFTLVRMVGGVGLRIAQVDDSGGLVVGGTTKGYGAEAASLQKDDIIVAVDGQILAELSREDEYAYLDDVGYLIAGELGTTVDFTVQRGGDQLDLTLVRDYPTKLPDSKHWAFSAEKVPEGHFQLTLDEPLVDGLYCYWRYQPSRLPGDFYCFFVGDDAYAQSIRSLAASTTPSPANTSLPPTVTQAVIGDGDGSTRFEKAECRFPFEPGQNVDCGDLIVPEDRSQPPENSIRLHTAIFRAGPSPEPDPVIYLHGGPGASALEWMAETYQTGFQHLFPNRDFIVFDQRGTGYAQPRLNCPAQAKEYAQSLAEDQRSSLLAWEAEHMDECLADLESTGLDLTAYTSLANAADLHDLIASLGYEQINLYGSSYGTYLALAYLQEFGDEGRIRSAVLEAPYPPQADLFAERATNAQRALDAVFAACAAEPACSTAYPNLEEVFYGLLAKLDAEPVTVPVFCPHTQTEQDVVVNGHRLLEAVYRSLYQAEGVSHLPKMLYNMQAGDYDLFAVAAERLFAVSDSVDSGIYYAILCNDKAESSSLEAVKAGSVGLHPLMRAYFDDTSQAMLEVCGHLNSDSTESGQNQPLVSAVPSLLLSGTFDPITPPAYGRLAAETLSQGYAYEFPQAAHGVLGSSPCAQTITFEFVQNPQEPQNPCLDRLPKIEFK